MKANDISKTKKYPPVTTHNRVANPLAGLICCSKCGSNFLRKGLYVVCSNPLCTNVGAKLDVVERRLIESIGSWLKGYSFEMSDSTPQEETELIITSEKALEKTKRELGTLRKQLSKTHDLLEQGVYDTETFLERSRGLNERINAAENSISEFEDNIAALKRNIIAKQSIIPKVKNLIKVYDTLPTPQAKNIVLKEVLEKVSYYREHRTCRAVPEDSFELTLFPKLPPNS